MINKNKDELINKKISEKDEAKIEYEKKLGDIKTKRGVHFSVNYLKDNEINSITFSNLKYKNKAKNISLYYNGEYESFNAISYELNQNTTLQDTKDITLIEKLNEEYKLKIVVNEIEDANTQYKNKLLEIDKKYSNLDSQEEISNNDIELKKGIKNS